MKKKDKPFINTLKQAPVDGGFRDDDKWIWCGSVIKGDNNQFHMFASMWEKTVPFTPNWLTNSYVVHAVSKTPEGPYSYESDVLPPRGQEYWDGMMTHNPTIHKWKDKYLLFYTGSTYQAERPSKEPVSKELRFEARSNQRIGMAVASSPNGPWTRPDAPCLDVCLTGWDSFMTTNPAPCVLDNGETYLLYKSTSSNTSPIQYGAARAQSPEHPFERIGPDKPITFKDASIKYEDAYLWHQDGMFRIIFNDMTGKLTGEHHAGAHAVSDDCITWNLCDPPKAYSRTVNWEDGTTTTQGSFERPQLLIQNGIPTHLFAATADGSNGFSNADNTWNMVIPLTPDIS